MGPLFGGRSDKTREADGGNLDLEWLEETYKEFHREPELSTAEEKTELWPQTVRVNPGYAGYQRKTGRDIPVVICEESPTLIPGLRGE